MTAIALPVRQNTDAWLEARRGGVTASEMPIVTGNRDGLLDLWAVKSGLLDRAPVDEATQELYDLGHALEPVIADIYTRKTGEALVREMRLLRHRDVPWAMASLDRRRRLDRRPVELKYTPHRMWPTDGPEPVPADVQDQVQWQMFVTGARVADVAVLVGGRVDIHELPADKAYQRTLLALGEWFHDLVLRGEPPPIDGSESTRMTLQRLYPRPDETLVLPATPDVDEIVHQLYRAKAEAKAAEAHQGTLENALRALLGEATRVEGTGYRITWNRNKDSERTDWHAAFDEVAEAYLGEHSRASTIADHTFTTEGPRVLRAHFKEEATSWL
jgi:putative phage-type endonuclease